MLTSPIRSLSRLAEQGGRGVLAGLVATAAMTVSSTFEMALRGRKPSSAPPDAAGKVLGVQPRNPQGRQRFRNFVHWSYGAGWGSIGAAIRNSVPEPWASTAHFAAVWGTELSMLPALDVVPPVTRWDRKEIFIDILHHLVYVGSFAAVWRLMDKAE